MISIQPFWGTRWEIQPTLGGISNHWMDFHLVVGIPSVLDRFPTKWMEIQPLVLVGPDVAVRKGQHWLGCLEAWHWTYKGSLQIEFLEKFGILSQPGPPSSKVGTPKTKKKMMFILHFRLFWAYYFFMKKIIFLVGMTNGGPIPSWIDKILPPQLCTMCFITFLAIYQSKVCSGKIV